MFRLKSSKSVTPAGAPEKGRALGRRLKSQRVKKRRPAEKVIRPEKSLALALARRLAGVLALFALVSLGLLAAWTAMICLPAFEVAEARVAGAEHLSRFDVLRAAGVGSHSNLLALNVGKVEQKLLLHPWVAQALVERTLPNKVHITIVERQPELVALVEGRFYYLDKGFRSFAPLGSETAPDMPVLTGLSLADMLRPDDETMELLNLAKALWRDLPAADKGPGGRLSELHLDRVEGLSLVWNDLGATVKLGFEDFKERLARLDRVRADLNERGELGRAVFIDLDSERRVVVRLVGEAA